MNIKLVVDHICINKHTLELMKIFISHFRDKCGAATIAGIFGVSIFGFTNRIKRDC